MVVAVAVPYVDYEYGYLVLNEMSAADVVHSAASVVVVFVSIAHSEHEPLDLIDEGGIDAEEADAVGIAAVGANNTVNKRLSHWIESGADCADVVVLPIDSEHRHLRSNDTYVAVLV